MNIERQQGLDKRISNFKFKFMSELLSQCRNEGEGAYVVCGLTQDFIQMLWKTVSKGMNPQEAKAALKVALDTVIIDKGMSIVIHEFRQ